MASLEHNCETLAIALLAEQAGLAALVPNGIVHSDKQTNTAADTVDRIVCEAGQREVYTYGKNHSTPLVWRVPVTVTIRLDTNNTTTLDAYQAAVNAAFTGTASAAIVTLAGTLSLPGLTIQDQETGGEHEQESDERIRSKTWDFLVNA